MTEEVHTKSNKVVCSGNGRQSTEHPKIYLEIAYDSDRIVCPYCSKIFILERKSL